MQDTIVVPDLSFISEENKKVIEDISIKMESLNYKNEIGPGYCWGKYMITFKNKNLKNPKNAARIYLRENEIVLRLFLPDINAHREYIENASAKIKYPFINDYGKCKHCHNDKNGKCNFRRSYKLFNIQYEKCSESTIQYFKPKFEYVDEYIGLFKEFYCRKAKKK